MSDRYDEEWQQYRCSDCDPELADEDEPEDPANQYEKPYVMLVPKGEAKPDLCPRCGSYLSLCEGDTGLHITNTPYERWAAKHAEEESN